MKLEKPINTINKTIRLITDLFMNVFILAIIVDLLFRDTFGILTTIGSLLNNLSTDGFSGLICMMVVYFWLKNN